MQNIKLINEYFERIKDDTNFGDIALVENLLSKQRVELYEYLKDNHALYAGGEIGDEDIVKVRNVMINLWIKATEKNKKYGARR